MENDFLAWLSRSAREHPEVRVGIGDDAALLSCPPGEIVVATDMLCDGVHFDAAKVPPRKIGRKALAVNLSDLAAMAATPVAAFVSVALPRGSDECFAVEIMKGISKLADEFDVCVAGGDTNVWDGELVINVCVVGRSEQDQAKLRRSAEPGDAIMVTGNLGGSILGHHLSFQPRIREAQQIAKVSRVHACMDISDGLLLDLSRMMTASNTGAVIDYAQVPISDAAKRLAETTGKHPLDHALSDGEDFELLFTVPSKDTIHLLSDPPFASPAIRQIGTVIGEASGIFRRTADGDLLGITPVGFEHK